MGKSRQKKYFQDDLIFDDQKRRRETARRKKRVTKTRDRDPEKDIDNEVADQ